MYVIHIFIEKISNHFLIHFDSDPLKKRVHDRTLKGINDPTPLVLLLLPFTFLKIIYIFIAIMIF